MLNTVQLPFSRHILHENLYAAAKLLPSSLASVTATLPALVAKG